MLVIENCNSLSDLRQKLIDGEEVKTARNEPGKGVISRAEALEAIRKLPHAGWLVSAESVLNVLSGLPPVTPLEQEPSNDMVSRRVFEQVMWERDVAIEQLKDLGYGFGEKPKTGHWIYRIYGEFHEEGNWHCSKCDYVFNGGYGHVEYCPKCGCEMSEPPTEEVMRT